MSYKARIDYTYGGSANFSIPFPYIDKSHIVVYVNNTIINSYSFTSTSQISISSSLTTGDIVSIRRSTPIENAFVDFTDTSILDEDVQNLARNQILYHLQEVEDMYSDALTAEEVTNITQNCVTYNYINNIADYSTLATNVTNVTNNVEALVNASNVYQDKKTLSTGTIELEDDITIYYSEPNANITYTIDTDELTETGKVITFELVVKQPSTAVTITLPTASWIGTESSNTPPTINTSGMTYMIVFRSFDNGTNWVGNLQGGF